MTKRVGLIELPAFKLLDEQGFNWTAFRRHDPLGGKQVLAAQLENGGFDVDIINLKDGEQQIDLGECQWNGKRLRKMVVGTDWRNLDPRDAEVWGVTVNYLQERHVSCDVIRHLKRNGGRVVVGGSDAFAEPRPYLHAGADAVVKDKSGAANLPLIDHVLGRTPRVPLSGVVLTDGTELAARRPPMRPEEWPLPSHQVVEQTMGMNYWEAPLDDSLSPIGAVMLDLGCDRHCDFCETPTYRVGYRWMSPERSLRWLDAQKSAGAKSVIVLSDQFLGRVLWKTGRADVLDIMSGFRELGVTALWGNGLEINKATIGRGMRDGDPTPDQELVEALWGWDGKNGCAQAYIPAERPVAGPKAYDKLLPWQLHCDMMKAIVKTGLPDITYGVIVGLPDDSPDEMEALIQALTGLRWQLKEINPELRFRVVPYAIRPLPGTPQARSLDKLGLIRFTDPAILGGFWTACADTYHMSYEEVSDWQERLVVELSDNEPGFQGITAINR